jgi:hypothetical protein
VRAFFRSLARKKEKKRKEEKNQQSFFEEVYTYPIRRERQNRMGLVDSEEKEITRSTRG